MTPEQLQKLQRYQRICALCNSPESNEAAVARSKRAAMEKADPWLRDAAAAQAQAQAQPPPQMNLGQAGAAVETILGWLNFVSKEGTATRANPQARFTGRALVQPRVTPLSGGGMQLVVDIPQATLVFLEQQSEADRVAAVLGIQDRVQSALAQVLGDTGSSM